MECLSLTEHSLIMCLTAFKSTESPCVRARERPCFDRGRAAVSAVINGRVLFHDRLKQRRFKGKVFKTQTKEENCWRAMAAC